MADGPNWSGRVSANGVTLPHWGVENLWIVLVLGQLVAPGGGSGTHSGCHW